MILDYNVFFVFSQQTDVRASLEHFSSTPVKLLPIKREDTPPTPLTPLTLAPLTSLANLPSNNLSSTPLSLAPVSKLLTPTDNKSLMRFVDYTLQFCAQFLNLAFKTVTKFYDENFSISQKSIKIEAFWRKFIKVSPAVNCDSKNNIHCWSVTWSSDLSGTFFSESHQMTSLEQFYSVQSPSFCTFV